MHQSEFEKCIIEKAGCLLFIFLIAVFSCNKITDNPGMSSGPTTTLIPPGQPLLHSFEIKVVDSSSTASRIEWTSAVDRHEDSIRYTVFLDSIEVASSLNTRSFNLTKLTADSSYHILVKATDRKNNSFSASYDLVQFDGYLKFAKSIYTDLNPYDILITTDKSYLLGATKNDLLFIAEIDSLGNELWSKNYSYYGTNVRLKATREGYLILVGTYLLKIDFRGMVLWFKDFAPYKTTFISFVETMNHEIILAGNESKNDPRYGATYYASILKLTASGHMVFRKTNFSTAYTLSDIIASDNENGFFVFGSKPAPLASGNFLLLKMDENGNFLWEKMYGDARNDYAVQLKLINKQLLLVGTSVTSWLSSDIQVLRTDLEGNLLKKMDLKKVYPKNLATCIEPTTDNGYVIVGASGSGRGDVAVIARFDGLDNMEWFKTHAPKYWFSAAYAIKQTADKGFIVPAMKFWIDVPGIRDQSTWLLKLNPSGNY